MRPGITDRNPEDRALASVRVARDISIADRE